MTAKGKDTWPGTIKAIGLRSLSTGRFWQFCFLLVLVWLIWQIKSEDWVKIAELFLSSHVYAGLGWSLWILTVIGAITLHKAQRMRYLAEIERVTAERNRLQSERLPHAKPSKFKKK